MPEDIAMCCFCGESVNLSKAIEISIAPVSNNKEVQVVYSHRKCLNDVLHKNVPTNENLDDE